VPHMRLDQLAFALYKVRGARSSVLVAWVDPVHATSMPGKACALLSAFWRACNRCMHDAASRAGHALSYQAAELQHSRATQLCRATCCLWVCVCATSSLLM